MVYDDFVIQILRGEDGVYQVVAQSPAGAGKGSFEIPAGLGPAAQGTLGAGSRELDEPPSKARPAPKAREVGDRLFAALFKDNDIRDLFSESRGISRGHGLRIRLRIDPDLGRVIALPWELLYRARTNDFLAADPRFSVVRSLDVMRWVSPPPKAGPLRILAVSLAPLGYADLKLGEECLILERAAKKILAADIDFRENPKRGELRADLRAGRFHVLHIMGHGTFDSARGTGSLLFAGPNSAPQPVSGQELAADLKGCRDLRLVVLNTCHSAHSAEADGVPPFAGVAPALLQGGVPAVVAMRSRISDRAAVAFSETFYPQLAAKDGGNEVDIAVAEGRLAIKREEGEDGGWDLPVLFLPREDERLPNRRSFAKALSLFLLLLLLVLGGRLIYGRTLEAIGLNQRGVERARAGELGEARNLFLAALRFDSGYASPWSNLAGVEERLGRLDAAVKDARTAVEKAPDQVAYQYNYGRLLARRDDHEALQVLRRAVDLEPCHAAAYNELGNLYLELNRPADARRALEAGLRCDRTTGPLARGPLLKNLGRVALMEGKPAEAVTHLNEALTFYDQEERRDTWEPAYWLAVAYAREGRRDLSCRWLRDPAFGAAGKAARQAEAELLAKQQRCSEVN
ncbi:MAG TPA: CHAT domain-containing protein [Thermoanaerobaculia bacterium]|nr:CHAT domain-containing protein [Thermoanaerobaculia bacterium]